MKSVGELSKVCSQIVLKCLYLARIDILRSVNKLARAVTKWTRACDKCLARLISYIHHTREFKQYCHEGNTAQQCSLGLFHDSDFAGDLDDSKSTSGRILCILGSHTFVPISWMCKKQTSVSHSSTESEIISLDAGLRMNGIPALDLWDLVIEVLHSSSNQHKKSKRQCAGHNDLELCNVDYVSSNVKSSQSGAMLHIFEDDEAVIKMIIKGRSPTMRLVSRTYRVPLHWFFDRIHLDPKIQIKYVDTKNQLADILTKGSFTHDEWNNLHHLFNISIFSSASCFEAMSKRMRHEPGEGEEKNVAKSSRR